jgi:FkbM family methyltransferase
MPHLSVQRWFSMQEASIGKRIRSEVREHGWLATIRACYFILASKMGKQRFMIPLLGYPFRVRANARKLGVDGILFSRRERFEPELKPYFRLGHPGEAFFDIGANYGYWSRYVLTDARRRGISNASVVAFEPLPDNYGLLVENMKRVPESDTSVHCEPMAVSEAAGTCFMNLSNEDPGSSFASETGTVPCRVTTIDAYVEEHHIQKVGLMKVDVEGYELHVLRGARKTIQRDRPQIICELIPAYLARSGATLDEVMREISGMGYGVHPISDADYLLYPQGSKVPAFRTDQLKENGAGALLQEPEVLPRYLGITEAAH